mgnify:CR=1 FL=1
MGDAGGIPWDQIHKEAAQLAQRLLQQRVDLNEASKLGGYYRMKGYSEAAVRKYLTIMSERPPVRSNRTKPHFIAMRSIWFSWASALQGSNKARAWEWGIRIARVCR